MKKIINPKSLIGKTVKTKSGERYIVCLRYGKISLRPAQ